MNTWVQLTGQFDGTAWKLYRNGVEIATKSTATGALPVGANWAIGARGQGDSRFFKGRLDEVRIYNRALNAEERAALVAEQGHSPAMENQWTTVPTASSLIAGLQVATLVATDVDSEPAPLFEFLAGNENGGLAIDALGRVTITDPALLDLAAHGPYEYTVRVTDSTNRTAIAQFALAAEGGFVISGSDVAGQNEEYSVTLAGGISFVPWTIHWGDGTTSTLPGTATTATHVYQSPAALQISAEVGTGGAMIAADTTAAAPSVTQLPGADLLVNGSFEQNAVTHPSGWDIFDSIPGWSVAWRAHANAKIELHRGILGGPAEGAQHIELDGDHNGHVGTSPSPEPGSMGIAQEVATVPGARYVVSFQFAARPGTSLAENVLDFSVADSGVNLLASDLITAEAYGWTTHTYEFVAQGTRTLLAFADGGTANSVGTLLDAVVLAKKVERPDIEFDVAKVTASATEWLDPANPGKTPLDDGEPDGLVIGLSGISVIGAVGVYRSANVNAAAIDDDFISRSSSETFYFDDPHVSSSWTIFRGSDYNLSNLRLHSQWREQIKGITQEAFNALTPAEKTALNTEYVVWRDLNVTGHRMAGTLNVTYEYAAEGVVGHTWINGRQTPPYNLFRGELTPPGDAYPYGRTLNADRGLWASDYKHSATRPAGWGVVSTLTISLSFLIDREFNISNVTGTITIDDIDGISTIEVSPVVGVL